MPKIMLTAAFANPEFASSDREKGLEHLRSLGELVDEPAILTADHAPDLIASIAASSVYTDEFYEAATDLRIVARWGVGFDQVNVEGATRNGVIITITPVHMDAVAEYAVAQWMATLKRVYTLNRLSHQGDFSIIRTYEAQHTTLGLYGCGPHRPRGRQARRTSAGRKGPLADLRYAPRYRRGRRAIRRRSRRFTRCALCRVGYGITACLWRRDHRRL